MTARHDEFLQAGGRLYALSADTPGQNAAVMEKMELTFPIVSDIDRTQAIEPLGFADEKDPRQISRPGVVIVSPDAEVVHRFVGSDYADRPDEDGLLEQLASLGLPATTQDPPAVGAIEPGEKAISYKGLRSYLNGAKFATLALRRRHRDLGDEFRADTKAYIAMVERYLEALSTVDRRKA